MGNPPAWNTTNGDDMSRAWIFGARTNEQVDRETQLIRWTARQAELRAERSRILGVESVERRPYRYSL